MWVLRLLGWLTGGLSIFGLVQRYTDQPLSQVFADVLGFYQALLHPYAEAIAAGIAWLFLAMFDMEIPEIPPDAVILYVLGLGAAMRAWDNLLDDNSVQKQAGSALDEIGFSYVSFQRRCRETLGRCKLSWIEPLVRVSITFLFITILTVMLALFVALWPVIAAASNRVGLVAFSLQVAGALGVFLLFFALNAGFNAIPSLP